MLQTSKYLPMITQKRVLIIGRGFDPTGYAEISKNYDLLVSVNGSASSATFLKSNVDIEVADNSIFHPNSGEVGRIRVEGLMPERQSKPLLICLKSNKYKFPKEFAVKYGHLFSGITHLGVSRIRRRICWLLRDFRVGSFPNFRLSTGMTAALLMLANGAASVHLVGFNPLFEAKDKKRPKHILADTYAFCLARSRGLEITSASTFHSSLMDNWGGVNPAWARTSIKNSVYFSGLFWW